MPDLYPIDAQRRSLGEKRLGEFIDCHARIQVMTLALVMSITTAPQTGYSDECVEAIEIDARDLLTAANDFAYWATELAKDWRAVRTERTPT